MCCALVDGTEGWSTESHGCRVGVVVHMLCCDEIPWYSGGCETTLFCRIAWLMINRSSNSEFYSTIQHCTV